MATKWKDLKRRATPEKRAQLKQEILAELDAMERTGMASLCSSAPKQHVTPDEETESVITKLPLH